MFKGSAISRRGISELYVDIMLTLIVISVSGTFTALLTNLSSYLRSDQSLDVGTPPLALAINHSGKSYLIVVNYEYSAREVAVICEGVEVGRHLIPPQGLLVVDLGSVKPSNTYVAAGNYLVSVTSLDVG